ncbi:F-box domain-containing protein [Seiridium cupressi]
MITSASIEDLPPEILSEVFDYLSRAAPSETLLHEQPHQDMLRRNTDDGKSTFDSAPHSPTSADLKSISCVSKRWRTIVLPSLFRNVIWRPQITSLKVFSLRPVPMLQFLLANNLDYYVTTFTLMVEFAADEVEESQLHRQMRPADLKWLWGRLFSVIDPLRFTIIAPPATLAALMNRMLFLTDAWSFDIPYHILSLARPTRVEKRERARPSACTTSTPPRSPSSSPSGDEDGSSVRKGSPKRRHLDWKEALDRGTIALPRNGRGSFQSVAAPASPIFTLRPWTSVLLNEGSSIRAYQTYEFFLRQAPSMLSALLGTGEYPNNQALLPPTVMDFNYIAVFPLASHVHTLLSNLPRLDRLFVQLTPRPSNQILQDQKAMKNIDMADLWMERNTAYSHLFAELTQAEPQGNWGTLKIFESGDAADKESWNMAVDFLERSNITNWTVERDGVLIKTGDDGQPSQSSGTVVHHLLGEEPLTIDLLSVHPRLSLDPMLAEMYLSCIHLGPDDPPTLFPALMEDLRNLQAAFGGLRRMHNLYPKIGRFGRPRLYRTTSGEFVSDIDEARDP